MKPKDIKFLIDIIQSAVAELSIPFIYIWLFACVCIMKIGRGVYWFGNMLSGFKLDPYNWMQEI